MDRKLIGLIAVSGVVLLAGCVGLTGAAADDRADNPEGTIEVTADGDATSEPDRATLRVAVEASGEDSAAVRQELAESDEQLRNALTEWGLEADQIRTDRYDIGETYQSREDPERAEFRGEHRYAIEINDVDAVGEVIDVAVGAGADSVQRIQFGLSDDREAELREEALADAMDNAHKDAAVLAENADLTVVGVLSVSTADRSVTPFRAEADLAMEDAATPRTGIETGDVSVSVSVQVVFEAEN